MALPVDRRRQTRKRAGVARIAERTDISARVRGVLEELGNTLNARFEPALRGTLNDLEQQLFKLAEQARNNAEQELAYASLREIKRGRADIGPRFAAAIESDLASFDREPEPPPASSVGPKLELMQEHVFEEDLALREVASRAEVRASEQLYELGHRFAVLAALPVFESERVPCGPQRVLLALRGAVADLDLPTAHRILGWRLFEKRVLGEAAQFYAEINQLLIARRILPNLIVYRHSRGASETSASVPAEPATSTPPPAARAGAAGDAMGHAPRASGAMVPGTPMLGGGYAYADPGSTPDHGGLAGHGGLGGAVGQHGLPAEAAGSDEMPLFDTLRELLAQRRRMTGQVDESGDGPDASREQVQAALQALQARPMPAGGKPGVSTQRLRQDLQGQLRRYGKDGKTPQLAPVQRDTVDLVSMLFDNLQREVRMGGAAQRFLGKLQVPLLRTALDDPAFFSQRNHPARKLLNTVTETAAYWVDSADGEADPSLVQKMQAVTERLLHDYDGDSGLYVHLLADLERHMQTLARRAEMSERRHVEAAQGRDRLDAARARAEEIIAQRLVGTRPSSLVRTLLEQAWTDALALAILRHGEDSDVFRERIATVEALLQRNPGDDTGKLQTEVQHGLQQVGLHTPDAEAIARKVLDQPVIDFSGEPVSQTELALKLKQRQRLGEDAGEAASKPVDAPLNAEEQRMLERLKSIPFGSWFEFQRNQQGDTVRRKLAWFSPVTGRCLFVNQRGQRAEERTLARLARDMVRGQIRLVTETQTSLVDRAWNTIVETLKKFTGRGPEPTPAGAAA